MSRPAFGFLTGFLLLFLCCLNTLNAVKHQRGDETKPETLLDSEKETLFSDPLHKSSKSYNQGSNKQSTEKSGIEEGIQTPPISFRDLEITEAGLVFKLKEAKTTKYTNGLLFEYWFGFEEVRLVCWLQTGSVIFAFIICFISMKVMDWKKTKVFYRDVPLISTLIQLGGNLRYYDSWKNPYVIARWLTASVLHVNELHLFCNILILLSIHGILLVHVSKETWFHFWILTCFTLSSIFTSSFFYVTTAKNITFGVGGSGGIFGLCSFTLILLPYLLGWQLLKNFVVFGFLLPVLIVGNSSLESYFLEKGNVLIDVWSHRIGTATGILLATIFLICDIFLFRKSLQAALAIAGLACSVACILLYLASFITVFLEVKHRGHEMHREILLSTIFFDSELKTKITKSTSAYDRRQLMSGKKYSRWDYLKGAEAASLLLLLDEQQRRKSDTTAVKI